jgi:tetratricopeptide (TPR) repeat protein
MEIVGFMGKSGSKIGAGISLFLFGATLVFAQNPPPNHPASATSAAGQDEAAASTPDHALAYYHYMLARRYRELAGLQNRSEDLGRAISEYKQAIAADPDSLFLRVELAELYWRSSRIGDAISEAESVLKQNPDEVDAHRLLAQIYFRYLGDNQPEKAMKENLAKAIEQFEAVTRLDPSDTNSWLLLGKLYKASNQGAKAEEALKKALNADPDSHGAIAQLAQLYVDQGDYAQAIDLLHKIPDEERDSTVFGLLGYAYGQTHDNDRAIEAYKSALEQDPENEEIRQAYSEALLGAGKMDDARSELTHILKSDPENATAYLRLGRLDREEGHFEEARKDLEHAKALQSDNLEVTYEEVLLEDATGNDDTAIQLAQGALKQLEKPDGQYTAAEASNRAVFLERLGAIYRTEEKYDQAIATFKQIATLGKSEEPRAEGLIVETLRLDHQPKKAIEEAQAALAKYPDDRPLHLLEASMLGEQGQVDQAVQKLQALITSKPDDDDLEVYRALAQVYSQAKRFSEAEAAAQKALTLSAKPDDQKYAYFLLGSIYEREKKYDLAEQQFKKVLDADPLNAAASNYLGYMLADRGVRLEESVKYIQKAVQLEPNNGAYLDSLGWAYLKMNRTDLAAPPLEKAARLVQDDPTILEHLGHLYLQMGKRQQAEQAWERALKEWPTAVGSDFDADQAAKLKQQLEELKNKN